MPRRELGERVEGYGERRWKRWRGFLYDSGKEEGTIAVLR